MSDAILVSCVRNGTGDGVFGGMGGGGPTIQEAVKQCKGKTKS